MTVKEKPLKMFRAKIWVHPGTGGDDEFYKGTIPAKTKAAAIKHIREFLESKKSAVMNDYILEEVKS